MTEEHIKELLGTAYVNAISANAGIMCSKPQLDYGMDGQFQDVDYDSVHKRFSANGFNIDFQLKSTINIKAKKGMLFYDLEVKNYRDLIRTDIGTERILILYLLPRDKNEWIKFFKSGIILKKCAWWCSLKGMGDVKNKDRIRIRIPENQVLTSNELRRLINCVKGGVDL